MASNILYLYSRVDMQWEPRDELPYYSAHPNREALPLPFQKQQPSSERGNVQKNPSFRKEFPNVRLAHHNSGYSMTVTSMTQKKASKGRARP